MKTKIKSLRGKKNEVKELASAYSKALTILKQYDHDELKIVARKKPAFSFKYEDAKKIVEGLKKELLAVKEAGGLFGQEYRGKFESVIKNLCQTFGGKELYKSVEEKAANLLYLAAKDHPFADGNKRIAAFLFVYFLHKNKYLYKKSGEKKISDSALVALTLLVAISNPKDKDTMVKIITNLLI